MKRYRVEITAIYNGGMYIEAESPEEAVFKANKTLDEDVIREFNDCIELPHNGYCEFGEITADFAEEISN